jgi:hypothetical protein
MVDRTIKELWKSLADVSAPLKLNPNVGTPNEHQLQLW